MTTFDKFCCLFLHKHDSSKKFTRRFRAKNPPRPWFLAGPSFPCAKVWIGSRTFHHRIEFDQVLPSPVLDVLRPITQRCHYGHHRHYIYPAWQIRPHGRNGVPPSQERVRVRVCIDPLVHDSRPHYLHRHCGATSHFGV